MATNDLMSELQKDSIKLDDDSERKVVRMLLKLLEDKNGEVQNLAVKCLGPLVSKVKEFQVETIVDTLCSNMVSDKEQLRDISSIGLKTVIGELPSASHPLAASVCKRITGRITGAIAKQDDVSVQLEALDILGDLLSRFGGLLISFHPTIQQALLPQLSSPRLAVRKRSIIALGHLVMSCNNQLFNTLIDFLLGELTQNTNISTTRTYVQCIGAITRQAGHRVGEHIEAILPHMVRYCKVEDDELREYCLQAFESFVRRCPKEISTHIPTIITLCLEYLCYDPNYNYDDDDDDEDSMDTEADEEQGESDDEYSDDDDMSWKVRRASAKCLEAIVATRHEILPELYKTVSPALISRFKEREENVKADLFHAYIMLLKQTRPKVSSGSVDPDAMEQGDRCVMMTSSDKDFRFMATNDLMSELQKDSIKLDDDSERKVVRMLLKLLEDKNGEVQNLAVKCLGPLVSKVKEFQVETIVDTLCSNMVSDKEQLRDISSIGLKTVIGELPSASHPLAASVCKRITGRITGAIAKAIWRRRVTASASNIEAILPHHGALLQVEDDELREYCLQAFRVVRPTLPRRRYRRIFPQGQIICNLGDILSSELGVCLPIFLERLKNEITRLTTVKALTKIAGSPLKIDLRPILGEAVPILASFLRKNHRALKLSTLTCLDVLVQNYGGALTPHMMENTMSELPPLVNESDLHISQLTLTLLTSLCAIHPSSMTNISDAILPEIMVLVRSPLLQGGALTALLELFRNLVATGLPQVAFRELLQMLTAPIYNPSPQTQPLTSAFAVHKQAFHSIAKCVATLTLVCPQEGASVIHQFVNDVKSSKSTDSVRLFAMLALGEIGKHEDLSGQPELKEVLLNAFNSHNEEVKSAASYALGLLQGQVPAIVKALHRQLKEKSVKTRQGCLALLTELVTVLPGALTENVPLLIPGIIFCLGYKNSSSNMKIDTLAFLNCVMAAHSPEVFHPHINILVPKELIREVEMGPFKHTVDDGLDIRKAAFECMYTLLDTCLDRLDLFEFLNHVEDGLKDHYDIKMLTYLMLVRLASLCPSVTLQRVDRLVEPLKNTCLAKVKANSVKQEYEKQDELKRSALRAVAALLGIPDADKNPLMSDFLAQIKSNAELSTMFDSIQKDVCAVASETSLMDLS
ncbi:PREDICTED: cullin-associated NEDD8-dissociated protein 1-like [Priapulus caudatus]|uniref:Cullin-associated NEDD8-dissociated protein 1-like n=1 Tax=Priapulus caudatus TaxID=37621 RepID=A0ABM1DQ78_PRICU|nr:PREDICTED: cullin-associated NEDD8-dissociated protein 1-like [Priapulus caudatus]